jgi:solute carrier family 25 folate transporter 32
MVGHGAPKYSGIVSTARVILAEEGWRAFYAGLGTNMIRAVPSSVVTLATYELASHYLKKNFIYDEGLANLQL